MTNQYGGSDPDEHFIRFKNNLIEKDSFFDNDEWWENLVVHLQYEMSNDDPQERSLLLTLTSLLIWGNFYTKNVTLVGKEHTEYTRTFVEVFNRSTINMEYSTVEDNVSYGTYFDKNLFVLFLSTLVDSVKLLDEYRKTREFLTVTDSEGNVSLSPLNFDQRDLDQASDRWDADEENSGWIEKDGKEREKIANRIARARPLSMMDINEVSYIHASKVGPSRFNKGRGRNNMPYISKSEIGEQIDTTGPEMLIESLYNKYGSDKYTFDSKLSGSSGGRSNAIVGGVIAEVVMVIESIKEQIKSEMWGKLKDINTFSYDILKKKELYDIGQRYGMAKHNKVGQLVEMVRYTIEDHNNYKNYPKLPNNSFDKESPDSGWAVLGRRDELWDVTLKYTHYNRIINKLNDKKNRLERKIEEKLVNSTSELIIREGHKHNSQSIKEEYYWMDENIFELLITISSIIFIIFKKYSDIGYENIEIEEEFMHYGDDFQDYINNISMVLEVKYWSRFLKKIFTTDTYEKIEVRLGEGSLDALDAEDSEDSEDSEDDPFSDDDFEDWESLPDGGAKKLVEYKKINLGPSPGIFKSIFSRIEVLKEQLTPSPSNPPHTVVQHLYDERYIFDPPNGGLDLVGGNHIVIQTQIARVIENEINQHHIFSKIIEFNELEGQQRVLDAGEEARRESSESKLGMINKLFANFPGNNPITNQYGILKTLQILKDSEYNFVVLDRVRRGDISVQGIPINILGALYNNDRVRTVTRRMLTGSKKKIEITKDTTYKCSDSESGICVIPEKYVGIDESIYSVIWPERHEYLKNLDKRKEEYPFDLDVEELEENMFDINEKIQGIIYEDSVREEILDKINLKIIKDFLNRPGLKTELKPFEESELRRPLKRSPTTRIPGRLLKTGVGVGDTNRMSWKINPLRKNDIDFWIASSKYFDLDDVLLPVENSKYILSLPTIEGELLLDSILDIEEKDEENGEYAKVLKRSIDDFDYNEDELLEEFFIKIEQLEDMFDSGNPDSLQRKISIVYTDGMNKPILDADGKMVKTEVVDYMVIKDDFIKGVTTAEHAASKVLPFFIGYNADEEPLFIMEEFATLKNQPKYSSRYFENDAVSLIGAPENVRSFARRVRNDPNPDYEELGYNPNEVESRIPGKDTGIDKRDDETYTNYYSRIGNRYKGGAKKKQKRTLRKGKKRNLTKKKNKFITRKSKSKVKKTGKIRTKRKG